ncbi:Hypothetical predicted protein [Xyrichtys novacula]|uniref:Uncharacterized protein n=1 Tax=Xyrichtys novacula TaxID=13765 RepID=A0AAV1GXH3_XYRNO|nr:Hypothetical predicted protein [Xyrichtys novacula]
METTSQRFTRTSVLVRSFHWSCPRPILKRVTATPMSRSKPRCVRVEQYSLIQNQDKCTPRLLLRKVPPMDGPPRFSSPRLNQLPPVLFQADLKEGRGNTHVPFQASLCPSGAVQPHPEPG